MELHHIVVATDESDAGRSAVRTGLDLARRTGARLTVMRVVPAGAMVGAAGFLEPEAEPGRLAPARRCLQQWAAAELNGGAVGVDVDVDVAYGVPSVEICRFAERAEADLLVLGRKHRSQVSRLLMGDTADAVARRSLVPSLYVPPETPPIRRMLAALDGTDRGLAVFRAAAALSGALGAGLRLVTVEPVRPQEPEDLAGELPTGRTLRLQAQLDRLATPAQRAAMAQPAGGGGLGLEVRRGEVVAEVLAAVEAQRPDLLAVGYHRGGLPGIIEVGSVARHLAHVAPCAFLAVPL